MTITVRPEWQRAMLRALREGLKPTRLANGTYRVRSVSCPGTFHLVTLDAAGHISACSDCKGWERYHRSNPCKHAGAVALARAYEMGANLVPAAQIRHDQPVIESSSRGRSQLFQEA